MELDLSSSKQAGPYIQAIFNKCLKHQSPLYTNNIMESSVCLLSHCTISIPPFRVPSTVNAARTTRPNLILRHASTSLPMGFSGRPVQRLLTPVVCSVNGPPTPPRNNKDDGSIVTWAVMALAGALRALGSSYMSNQKTTTSSITFTKGSSRHKNIDQPADKANELIALMDGEKGNTMHDKLKEMFQKNPDEAYFVGMNLIKILVSRENFRAGINIGGVILEELYGNSDSSLLKKGDLFLYMVLMHGMDRDAKKAESWWNKFKSLTDHEEITPLPPSPEDSSSDRKFKN